MALLLARARRSARALLKAEARALARLRRSAHAVIDRLRGELADLPGGLPRERVMLLVRRAVSRLRQALEQAILEARQDARAAARASLPRGARPSNEPWHSGPFEEDRAPAHTAATSYAGAWGAAVIAMVLESRHEGDDWPPSPPLLDGRLATTAATEVARAFNDERERVARELAGTPEGESYVKVWSAMLDRRTCRHCRECDGEMRELAERFSHRIPAHPNCRCVALIVTRDEAHA